MRFFDTQILDGFGLIAPLSNPRLLLFGPHHSKFFRMNGGDDGLEPATSAVTGQRSNQLSYVPIAISIAYRKLQILLSFLAVHSVACFHIFHRI